MLKEQILKGNKLLDEQYSLEKSIENAQKAENWDQLILNFNRAGLPDFLGAFDIVKERFITAVTRKLKDVNQQIEDL